MSWRDSDGEEGGEESRDSGKERRVEILMRRGEGIGDSGGDKKERSGYSGGDRKERS